MSASDTSYNAGGHDRVAALALVVAELAIRTERRPERHYSNRITRALRMTTVEQAAYATAVDV